MRLRRRQYVASLSHLDEGSGLTFCKICRIFKPDDEPGPETTVPAGVSSNRCAGVRPLHSQLFFVVQFPRAYPTPQPSVDLYSSSG
jgi:hypothetical protein